MDIISYALSKKGMQQSVSDYLDEHLTNPTNPPLDTSLTIANAAADSKATGDKLSELKEGLNGKIPTMSHKDGTNFINPENISEGYIKDDGTVRIYNNWHNTGYIQLEEGTQYYHSKIYSGYYAFYDADFNAIQTSSAGDLANPFTVPVGAIYGRFSKNGSFDGSEWISTENKEPFAYAEVPTLGEYIKDNFGADNSGKILAVNSEGKATVNGDVLYKTHDPSTNYIDVSKVEKGYINNSGKIVTSSNWHNTGAISLSTGVAYYFHGLYDGSSGYYAFYDENNDVVEVGTSELPNPFTIPNGAIYGRFSKDGTFDGSEWIYTENEAPPECSYIDDSKIFVRKNQGIKNAGKLLAVGENGDVVPISQDTDYASRAVWLIGNLYHEAELIEGKYIYKNGKEQSYTGYYCTPFL